MTRPVLVRRPWRPAGAAHAGRQAARTLLGQNVASIHRGRERALAGLQAQQAAVVDALEERHVERVRPLRERFSSLETRERQLRDQDPEPPHPLLPAGTESRIVPLRGVLLLLALTAELTLTKAALDVFGQGLIETLAMSLGTLVALMVTAHLAGTTLRERRPATALTLFLAANVANAALTWLRVSYMQLRHAGGPQVPAGTALWTLLVLGALLILFAAALGTLRTSRAHRLQAVERTRAALALRLDQLEEAHAHHLRHQARLHSAEQAAFTLGWHSVYTGHQLPPSREVL